MKARGWCALLLLAAAGCKSAGPKAGSVTAAVGPTFLQSYVGQNRILVGQGDERNVAVRAGDDRVSGDCDVAVGIERAAFDKGGLRLSLSRLGRPRVEGAKPAKESCGSMPAGITLSLSDLSGQEPEAVETALSRILPTPEAYLAARGVSFDRPLESALGPVAAAEGIAAPGDERMLGRRVKVWPRRLLWVDAEYHDLSGKVRRAVELDFDAVVGVDGRLREPRLQTFIGATQEALVKRSLSVWRYEPAQGDGQPVAARVGGRMILRVY
jgi:hypothetical protein